LCSIALSKPWGRLCEPALDTSLHMNRSLFLSFAVAASLASTAVAQNDDCSGALPVVNGANGPYTNIGSTDSTPVWPCALGGSDVWYLYLSGGTGTLQADVCGATHDSAIEIFDGAGGCGSLVSLGCNDDSCGLASSLTVPVNAGVYYIRVGGFLGDVGNFTLNVNGPAVSGTLATNTTLGAGCISVPASFYELFPFSTFDLSNTGISMLPNGSGGYVTLAGVSLYVAPSGSASVLALGDDDDIAVALSAPFAYAGGTTTSLTVCSNGFVSVGAGNGTFYDPTAVDFLGNPDTGWYVWHDCNPTIPGSGQVKFEEVGGIAYITWDGVYDFGGSTAADANTFQIQFDTASGAVHFSFQAMSTTVNGNDFLVGYSPGGASADPGSVDLSTALVGTINLPAADVLPLTLAGATRPILGTNWSLTTSNVPASVLVGVDVFGFADPGINDLFFLGMPGCGLRSTLDVVGGWISTGATHGYSLPLPNNPVFVGTHLFTTSAALQPSANAFGAITANGIDGLLGDV